MSQQIRRAAQNNQSLFNRAQQMAEGKSQSELVEIAKNVCKSKGINYEQALAQFNQMWK